MSKPSWPDALLPPQPDHVQHLLSRFWTELTVLADLLPRNQFLLAGEQLHTLRQMILEMMLALNGIRRPATNDLNTYLSASQRAALEKTWLMPTAESGNWHEIWIGQAVALVVIYRWYAPQLVAKYALTYPRDQEATALQTLIKRLPTWPQQITTE